MRRLADRREYISNGDLRLLKGLMRVDDLPPAWAFLIDLGCVPAHRSFAAVAVEAVGEHCNTARDLDARLDHLEPVDTDLPSNLIVHGAQGGEAIEPLRGERIEVGDLRRRDIDEAIGIAPAPALERGALHPHYDSGSVRFGCDHANHPIGPHYPLSSGMQPAAISPFGTCLRWRARTAFLLFSAMASASILSHAGHHRVQRFRLPCRLVGTNPGQLPQSPPPPGPRLRAINRAAARTWTRHDLTAPV